MRRIRILSIIIFVISAGVFVFFKLSDKKTEDTNGPVISMDKDSIEVLAAAGNDELLTGVTAFDEKDGDVTSSLVVEQMTDFTERGRRTVTLAAFDSDNHVTKAVREVIYSDYTPPYFELSEPLYFPVNAEAFTDALTVSDALDGDLTSNIKMSAENAVQVNTSGDYQVVFSVSNSAGDTVRLPVTVTLYQPSEFQTLPAITLSKYLIYVKKGEKVNPWSYIEEVNYRGIIYKPDMDSGGNRVLAQEIEENDLEDSGGQVHGNSPYSFNQQDTLEDNRKYLKNISITNPVDSNTAGVYEIVYKVTADEEHGYETGTMRLIVVVEE